jgi:hypothetical protein
MPHDGGQHGSEETRSQTHDEQRDSGLEALKAEVRVCLSRKEERYPLWPKQGRKQTTVKNEQIQCRERGREG